MSKIIEAKVSKFKKGLIIETNLAEYRFKAKTIFIKLPEFSMLELYRESRYLQRQEECARCWHNWVEARSKKDIRIVNGWKLIASV